MNIRWQIGYVSIGFWLSFIIWQHHLCPLNRNGGQRCMQQPNKERDKIQRSIQNITNLIPQINTAHAVHVSHNTGSAVTGRGFDMQIRRRLPPSMHSNDKISPFSGDNYPMSCKWVVITSIFLPTRLIKTLGRLHDWCTVVVADLKSPPESSFMNSFDAKLPPKCLVYLTIEKQLKLEYKIMEHLPYNSFGRKNIGFVFAVHHGANTIYDTDDDNEIKDIDLLQFWSSPSANLNAIQWRWVGSNPYPKLGGSQINIWPRGLPLDKIKDASLREISPISFPDQLRTTSRCIIQSLADQEPDVDAIFRLTSPHYPVFFSPETRFSAGIKRDGDIAPFNAQAALFFEPAFESMILPITVHGRVSDIWRGYMAQSLKNPHCSLIFTPPWVVQIRNAHDYLRDFNAEIPLYQQSSALVEFFKNNSFSSQFDVVSAMFEYGILDEADVHLSKAWGVDMNRARLSSAILKTENNDTCREIDLVSFRHLLIIMGRGTHLRNWKRLVLESPEFSHIDLVLGVFDENVNSLECSGQDSRVSCVSVEGTTWTTGRNRLVKSAFVREREQSLFYSFWTLADADVDLHCPELTVPNLKECLIQYDSFLVSLPQEVSAAAVIGSGHWPVTSNSVMVSIQAMDAAWNSFRREVIHVLFPYESELDSNTWWSSQAIFWNKLQCLAPLYVVAPLYIFYGNPEHNDYPRNPRDFGAETKVVQRMMKKLSGILPRAPIDYPLEFKQERIQPLPLKVDSSPQASQVFHQCTQEFSESFYSFIFDP